MSERDAQVNIKLARGTLNEWDEYIEQESDFTTRSEFVRFAVNREVSNQRGSNQSNSDENIAILREIRDSVANLNSQIDSMENRIDTLQSAVRSDPQLEELANEIFSLLPDEKPGTRAWRKKGQALHDQGKAESDSEIQKRSHAWQGTPEGLSKAFDEPERRVHQALDKLISQTHLVKTKESHDGKKRYYKEV